MMSTPRAEIGGWPLIDSVNQSSTWSLRRLNFFSFSFDTWVVGSFKNTRHFLYIQITLNPSRAEGAYSTALRRRLRISCAPCTSSSSAFLPSSPSSSAARPAPASLTSSSSSSSSLLSTPVVRAPWNGDAASGISGFLFLSKSCA